ncbi:uncharacterized protein LOC119689292 isoform X1 [Teleopsis dalmanni]|uniref:uncharacterized protein LOC119689292 isoform X1 n=1 Tax=Teleopsis dalmanni TaxID=139649 RepID=UPI0018CE8909|nr:uncharacterized protein LOC119689292 isoform X1 [Teleopsis dalmanni]
MEHLRKKVLNAIHLLQNSSSIKQITKFIQKSTSDSNLFSAVEQICLEGKRSGLLDECWGYYYYRCSEFAKSDETSLFNKHNKETPEEWSDETSDECTSEESSETDSSEEIDDSKIYDEKEKMSLFNFYVSSINNFFDINLLEWFGIKNLTSSVINKKDTTIVVNRDGSGTNDVKSCSGANNVKSCYVRLKRLDNKPKPDFYAKLKKEKKKEICRHCGPLQKASK